MSRPLLILLVILICSSRLSAQVVVEGPEVLRAIQRIEQAGGKCFRAVTVVSFNSSKNLTSEDIRVSPFCDHLQELYLCFTPLDDDDLGRLRLDSLMYPQLTRLSLVGTRITDAGMVHLAGLRNLQTLDLSRTAITGSDFVELRNLTNLTKLDVGATKLNLRGVKSLKVLSSLEDLDVSATDIDGTALPHLAQLVNLVELRLNDTKIAGEDLNHLTPLTKLVTLEATRTLITDSSLSCLASMPKIQSVLIDRTRVTPKGLLELVEMRKYGYLRMLQFLFVDSSQITPEVRAALEKAFPHIHVVVVDEPRGEPASKKAPSR